MAQWKQRKISLPEGSEDALSSATSIAGTVKTFLDGLTTVLGVVKTFAQASFDAYSVLVNSFITETENYISDLKGSGIYVLLDYPQNFNFELLIPVSPANLAGTIVDPRALQVLTADDTGSEDRQSNLQAIARNRRSWNPPSRDMLSYRQAIQRITQAFDDPLDQYRPQFSDTASSVGVVLMVHSDEAATFIQLVRNIGSLFAVDGLDQLSIPGFEDFFPELNVPFSSLTAQELCELDLTVPGDFRSGGKHPNFLGPVSLEVLFPPLGILLKQLAQLVEQLRPAGDVTKLIQDSIDFLTKKVERIQRIADELETLLVQLKALDDLEFATIVIRSSTGDTGFKSALADATGNPEFDRALVCSVVFYAGGASANVLAALFSDSGKTIESSITKSLEDASRHIARPVLRP